VPPGPTEFDHAERATRAEDTVTLGQAHRRLGKIPYTEDHGDRIERGVDVWQRQGVTATQVHGASLLEAS
jgi:hypothetical protein